MITLDGSWTIEGCNWDDKQCLHSVDEAINLIENKGFMTFFKCDIPGLSLEEYTDGKYWWGNNATLDPWEWRAEIARRGNIAYGKFFENKNGFISLEWLADFVNYRRNGYDFDSLWDDEKATLRQKKIMDCFSDNDEIISNDLKQMAGFGKGGLKNFEGTATSLQMQMYLTTKDFRQRKNKKGEEYGWAIAVYATLEQMWGYDRVTSAYCVSPNESATKIYNYLKMNYPNATDKQIKKIVG